MKAEWQPSNMMEMCCSTWDKPSGEHTRKTMQKVCGKYVSEDGVKSTKKFADFERYMRLYNTRKSHQVED